MQRLMADALHLDVMSIGIQQAREQPRAIDSTAWSATIMGYLFDKLTVNTSRSKNNLNTIFK